MEALVKHEAATASVLDSIGNEEEEDGQDGLASALGDRAMINDASKLTVGQESQGAPSQMPKSVMSSRSVHPIEKRDPELIMFDEFLAQVSFKRTTEIGGYSSTRIQFTFIPYKLTNIEQQFTLFLEN
jgi:hypothetical protein